MMRPRRYTTYAQAELDAERITGAPFGLGIVASILRTAVADPHCGSDYLLILADGLRAVATAPEDIPPAHRATLTTWANTLATLAPTRADPIESDA